MTHMRIRLRSRSAQMNHRQNTVEKKTIEFKILFRSRGIQSYYGVDCWYVNSICMQQNTWSNLPLTMLNDSSELRKFCKLSSFNVFNCEWENCKWRMWLPPANKSGDRIVIDLSKSYIDSDCMGALINCNVDRNDPDVVLGQSRNKPARKKKMTETKIHLVLFFFV